MPWTETDVDKHKMGLTPKQKKQWVRISNSVLKAEMKKGKSEEEAAISAIKQANGVVMNTNESKGKFSNYKTKQVLDYDIKLTVHQEKAHLVIPVVMMVEGVHSGSQGPLLHEITELGKFPESWNGIPVVVYHPEEDGNAVSANSPDIIDKMTVGRVYNTSVEGKKLKAEVWLDEDKLNTISANTLEDINETKEVEVSLGMFTENELVEGEYEGEKYVGIAHNHRPDHLAILPDQIGACSCADGCGLGANEKNKDMAKLIDVEKTIKQLNSEGFSINQIGDYKKQGYNELIRKVNDALQKKNKEDKYYYLEELYDDSLVYQVSGKGEYLMYKQDYQITSGVVELTGNPVEVHRKVEYVVNSGWVRKNMSINNKKEDKKMPKNECPKCLEKINAVIANKESGFVETDREWLEVLSEAALDKTITPKVIEKIKEVEKTVEINKLSAEDQAALAFGKKQMKERKEKMVKGIIANTEKGTWDEATLNAMSEDILERVFTSVKKEETVDYSLQSNGFQANVNEVKPMAPTGIVFKTK
jgi:hypothetical protein